MAFDITVWCKGYNDINELGSVVKKNTHQFHKDGYSDFSQSEMDELTRKATDLCIQLTDYMNRNGIPHLQPKWNYSIKDVTTHVSHPDFAYSHLLDGEL